jgi:hypothetical protein
MLTREIAECRQVMDEYRQKGEPVPSGLAMYEMGLRTAAVMLGTEPEHWRRRPWVVRMWRRWIRGRG